MLDTFNCGYKQALLDILDLVDGFGYGGRHNIWGEILKSKKQLVNCLHTLLTLILTDRDAYQEFMLYHTTSRQDSPFVVLSKTGEVRFITEQHGRYIKTKRISGE